MKTRLDQEGELILALCSKLGIKQDLSQDNYLRSLALVYLACDSRYAEKNLEKINTAILRKCAKI